MAELKLFRTWSTPFALRIIWALKLKGIEYETIFEDLTNKSPLLLQHNPVLKKVPVLVHDGNAIAESLVILEYIEETWQNTPILPKDPYEKAMAPRHVLHTQGKEQEEATAAFMENLKFIEEEIRGKKVFGGETIGFLELALAWMANLISVFEEVTGLKVVDSETFQLIFAWMKNFSDVPVIREHWPPCGKLITRAKLCMRNTLQQQHQNELVHKALHEPSKFLQSHE
ncbi:glutathione transferase GST 23-like [Cornus florida]|uniref:glutathione transferase GST 23-like n=1 Tax=Cornus florida TaxID=4283 RepID=UPI0028A108D0|nr:glutathione transferase GST 23-like [Cornus florida]